MGIVSAQISMRIGVIDAPDGSLLTGAQLAADKVNAAGGIVGADGSIYRLDVVHSPPKNIEIAIANMRQSRVAALIGPAEGQVLAANLTSLQALGSPIFTTATGDTLLLADSSRRIFRIRAQASLQIYSLAQYLVQELNLRSLHSVQLDRASIRSINHMQRVLGGRGIALQNHVYNRASMNLPSIAAAVAQASPDALMLAGPPAVAANAYNRIRSAGYDGRVVYQDAGALDFVNQVPAANLPGILGSVSWLPSLSDPANSGFILEYARTFGTLPDALSAASYDAVQLIARASAASSNLLDGLRALQPVAGLQGQLLPSAPSAELSPNVLITRLNRYGTAEVVARYHQQRAQPFLQAGLAPTATAIPAPTATPLPTATPSGFHLIVQSNYQNVRDGPGLEYNVIGEVLQGTQLRVLGASEGYDWLVIDYRGRWGWMAAYLLDTYGDRNLLPIIPAPATPTPPPPLEADLVVESVLPEYLPLGQPASVFITVRNRGLRAAGSFAVAGTFEPGGQYSGMNLPGLGAQQATTIELRPTLNGAAGPQSVVIVVDLNQQVPEGPAGEANNNIFRYNYRAG